MVKKLTFKPACQLLFLQFCSIEIPMVHQKLPQVKIDHSDLRKSEKCISNVRFWIEIPPSVLLSFVYSIKETWGIATQQ